MAKRPSMDTIRKPDLDNLNSKQSKILNTYDRYARAEDHSGKVRADFSRAHAVQDIPVKKKEELNETEKLIQEFSARRVPVAAGKGVKINGVYVAKRRMITAICVVIGVILLISLFAPPLFVAKDDMSGCRKEDIFAKEGYTQYKSNLMKNKHDYNIDALSSERGSSYRICTVAFDAKNYLPFQVEVDDYAIDFDDDYDGHVVFSTYSGDSTTIPAFSSKTILVDILINADGLTDKEFDEAITSLSLKTIGAKKKLGKKLAVPCIPGRLRVSDVITFDPDV